jgi:hypothetical protein
MASFITNSGADGLQTGGGITFASDTIKARLVASSATLNKDDTSVAPSSAVALSGVSPSKTVAPVSAVLATLSSLEVDRHAAREARAAAIRADDDELMELGVFDE